MSEQLALFEKPSPVLTGAEKKRRVLDRMERNALRRVELEEMRKAIRHLMHSNPNGTRNGVPYTATSDDLRAYLNIQREQRKGRYRWFTSRNNLIGNAFTGFVKVGGVAAKSEGTHGREIKLWTLKQYENSVRSFLNNQNGSSK